MTARGTINGFNHLEIPPEKSLGGRRRGPVVIVLPPV